MCLWNSPHSSRKQFILLRDKFQCNLTGTRKILKYVHKFSDSTQSTGGIWLSCVGRTWWLISNRTDIVDRMVLPFLLWWLGEDSHHEDTQAAPRRGPCVRDSGPPASGQWETDIMWVSCVRTGSHSLARPFQCRQPWLALGLQLQERSKARPPNSWIFCPTETLKQ